ncbi:MAG: serine/threonine-protein kinase [Patulibacter minatonensis]
MGTRDRRPFLLRPGDRLAGYEIDDVLGVGGMATVYEATQSSLRRRVALKVLDPRLAEDDAFRERFRHEGAHLAALDHPSIVPVYDSGEDDGRLYLAMRLVDGETLADRMRSGGLSADEVVGITEQIASALDAAHAEGILHRDVKPQNVLLAGDRAFLADFGVAKSAAAATMTGTGGFLGSVHYAAPEQIRGQALGPPTDVYALAAMAYECLAGRPPFDRESEVGVIHGHLEEAPPALPGRGGRAMRDVGAVLAAGLAKVPDERPGSAGAFAAQLHRAVDRLGASERGRRPAFGDPLAERRPVATGAARANGAAGGSSAPTAGVTFVGEAATPGQGDRDAARAETVDLPADGQVRHMTVADRRTRFVPRAVAAGERRSRAATIAAVVLLVVAAGAAAALVLVRGPSETALTAGPFRLTVPGEVRVQRATAGAFAGLPATPGDSVSTGARGRVQVSLGMLGAGHALRLSEGGSPATVVTVEDRIGWSWPAATNDGRTSEVLVFPGAAKGAPAALVACAWPASFDGGDEVCQTAAAGLQGGGGRLTAAAAGAEQERLRKLVAALRSARSRALPRISASRATAARRLAKVHTEAEDALRALAADHPWDAGLVATAAVSAKAVADDLARLASAAPKYDRTADRRARAALDRHDLALRRTVGAIADRRPSPKGGAEVPRLRPLDATALRPKPEPRPTRAAVTSAPVVTATPPVAGSSGRAGGAASGASGGSSSGRTSSGGSSKGGGGGGGGETVVVPPSETG